MTADDIIMALLELDEAVNVLDQSVNVLEKMAHAPQRDLFGGWLDADAAEQAQAAPAPSNVSNIDTAALSRKLDAAIGRVQQILSEAA